MDAIHVCQLVYLFSQKRELSGPEYMLYKCLCELMELITRMQIRKLREEVDKDEPDSDPNESAQPDS